MTEPLHKRRCVPCEDSTTKPLTAQFVDEYLEAVPTWHGNPEKTEIQKAFSFPDFKSALHFVDTVGEIAEREGHHPDIELTWGKVIVKLSTHSIGGLTENDFILAAKIDTIG